MKLNVGKFLKKSIFPARLNHFLGFLQIFLRVEAAFFGWWKQSFHQILHRLVYTDFGLILNRMLLFRAFFFCYWNALLKLGVNQFSSIFSVPKRGISFRLVEMDILSNTIHSDKWKRVFF